MSKIKLVALDMDGTSAIPFGGVIDLNFDAIKRANDLKTYVCFVTGRPAVNPLNKIVENGLQGEHGIIAGYNGAMIYDLSNERVLEVNPIPKEKVEKAFKIIDKYNGASWGYTIDTNLVILSESFNQENNFKHESSFFKGEYLIKDRDVNFEFQDCLKILAFKPCQEMCDELDSIGLEVAWKPGGTAAEINLNGINKKFAVQWLAKKWKIEREEIMAMGDQANDIPMLEWVGLSVAPANAHESVKKICKHVTKETHLEGAVAKAIQEFVLQ